MKVIIELELTHNAILSFIDVQYEILEQIRALRYNHLTDLSISINEVKD